MGKGGLLIQAIEHHLRISFNLILVLSVFFYRDLLFTLCVGQLDGFVYWVEFYIELPSYLYVLVV